MVKTISEISGIPKGEHWAIIESGSYIVPGDERSRTNPGHGYPEHTESYIKYHIFESEEEVVSWIEQHNRFSRGPYRVLKVSPVTVEQKINLVRQG